MDNKIVDGKTIIPPSDFDYPEEGSAATIRVSFTGRQDDPRVPNTAFFVRLKNMLPDGEPLMIKEGDWDSYESARIDCWKIATKLARKDKQR